MILLPGENSGLKGSKNEKTSLEQFSMSTIWLLMSSHWHLVKELSKRVCWWEREYELGLMRDQRIWLGGSKYVLS